MLKGKFIALNFYIRKYERSKINDLCFYLNKTEKKIKLNVFRKNKVIKIKVEIDEIKNRKPIEKNQ